MTYCNVYAHDCAQLAGAYLPRVWWWRDALNQLIAGTTPAPEAEYDTTVHELSANGMYEWLLGAGHAFGWSVTEHAVGTADAGLIEARRAAVRAAQRSANEGILAVVATPNTEAHRGHIAVVAPEFADEEQRLHCRCDVDTNATRTAGAKGEEFFPVLTQAGRRDHMTCRSSQRGAFWIDERVDRMTVAIHQRSKAGTSK